MVPLVAVLLSNRGIAEAAERAWDAGEAILPLPIAAPAAEIARRLEAARPTHLVDRDGRRALAGGVPVESGTAAVIATSGTTAEPKLVELTRTGMEVMGRGYSHAVGADSSDRWLACMPLYHVASLAIVARAYVCGLPYVVHDSFDLARVAASHADDGATMISLVPTALARLLDAGAPVAELRCLIIGGAVLPPGLRARAESASARVVDAYGLSETWGGCAIDGVPNEGVEVRLGPEDEIEVRGAPVMRGYRFDPTATAAATTADGWFRTGDVGAYAPSAAAGVGSPRLRVIDRLKDMIISGGVNVSPTQVEDVLIQHPFVADVCVVGVPDAEWGERVVAVTVARDPSEPPTLHDLRTFARDLLSAPMLPREVRIVPAIPRSASGKALRRALASPSASLDA